MRVKVVLFTIMLFVIPTTCISADYIKNADGTISRVSTSRPFDKEERELIELIDAIQQEIDSLIVMKSEQQAKLTELRRLK